MRTAITALLIAAALPIAASAHAAPAEAIAQPAEPRMVQPESLEQGFILVVTDKSRTASAASPIYIASSHNGWNPADPEARLTPRSDMRWQIEFAKPTLDSRIAFKFTRGSWDLVETTADFKAIDNRTLPLIDASALAPGEKPIIELTVESWRDVNPETPARSVSNPYRPITVIEGTIRRVETVGGGVPIVRDVLVWLPPGYDAPENKDRRYPVLYLQDGQNLFEQHPGIPAEWKADETAAELIRSGEIEPLIIVSIPNAGAARISEYSPVELLNGVEPRGGEYVRYLVGEVVPRVDRAFRTKTGPENTAVGGSSLGGIIALEAATEHPDVFGMALAESPSLVLRDWAAMRRLMGKQEWPRRLYIGMGGRESNDDANRNAAHVKAARDLENLAKNKGVAGTHLMIDPDAVHNEDAWAERLPAALRFLFPAEE